ncbi:hypothetical protein AND_009138 [Anopheles darlingi]|uniref:Uncharacterized protein n=1 Tax=Anopheles darlingi TaxID=43151 RepID=W5J4A8_ANODA|nr:hypothetical protein AND_009138 [Anopheles darlingi]
MSKNVELLFLFISSDRSAESVQVAAAVAAEAEVKDKRRAMTVPSRSLAVALVLCASMCLFLLCPADASYHALALEGWPYAFPLGPWHDYSLAEKATVPVPIEPVVAAHLGSYPGAYAIMATRGSIHIAPLPGHSVSQFQYNFDAPPGTY